MVFERTDEIRGVEGRRRRSRAAAADGVFLLGETCLCEERGNGWEVEKGYIIRLCKRRFKASHF
jgi:hypothetical protein